jgi:hypothetical protein
MRAVIEESALEVRSRNAIRTSSGTFEVLVELIGSPGSLHPGMSKPSRTLWAARDLALDKLRRFHRRVVLFLFCNSDEEACSAQRFFARFRRLRCRCRLGNYGRFGNAEEVFCSVS